MNALHARSHRMARAIALVLLLGALVGLSSCAGPQAEVLTDSLSVPLDGATAAVVDVNVGTGNLTIDELAAGERLLASGALEYYEAQGLPARTVDASGGQATLTLRGRALNVSSFRWPWEACYGAYNWQIHLNAGVPSDITAHSDGGNVVLHLAGLAVTRLVADTGGGNMDVVLPDNAAGLDVAARTGGGNVTVEIGSGTTGAGAVNASSGAGNVVVTVPGPVAARIHATSGMGKVIVDPRFAQVDGNTYESPDYAGAANRVEITLSSGAGNVSVNAK